MNRIKVLRKMKGFTQTELCKKLDVTQSAFSLWESGKFEPDIKTVFQLCDLLECTTDYLLGRTDENGVVFHEEETKIDNLYMHLARETEKMRLPEEDIDKILEFARYMKEKNDKMRE